MCNTEGTSPKSWCESYRYRGLYGGILRTPGGLLQEKFEEHPMICSMEEVEKGLEQQRKIILETMGIDNLEFEEIDFNDLKFLNYNEVHNRMYSEVSDIKQDIVREALRISHISPEEESDKQSDDLSTSVTDEFVSLLAEAYKDNPDFHFIPSMTFNQILQSCGEKLSGTDKKDNLSWKKIFASVYHVKHFYGCIAHVKENKFYIVDSCRVVTLESYRSTVLVLLVYMIRQLNLRQGNWTVHIINNYPRQHVDRNCGVFMCKCFQYWARGERLSLDETNIIAARLILLYEVREQKLADERMWENKPSQCVSRGRDSFYKKMESSEPSDTPPKVELRKLEPEWLERFLPRKFHDDCSNPLCASTKLTQYCIDCDKPLCQSCLSQDPHEGHGLLKLYRHVYQDVVPLDEIERQIDCSRIQSYRCNKQLVISLSPLPHTGGKANDEARCRTCKRKLIEHNFYSYCSLTCKVDAFRKKEHDDAPPFLLLDPLVQKARQGSVRKKRNVDPLVRKARKKETEVKKTPLDQLAQKAKQESESVKTADNQPEEKAEEEPEDGKRTRKRKGIPHRAPFF